MKTTVILTLILIALFVLPGLLFASPAEDISQDDFIARQNTASDFILLDVRSKEEFTQGHIKGALNISHSEIKERMSEISKDKDVIIYCRSGKRASIAAKALANNGYERLFHLDGDMNGWVKNNRPVSLEK